MRPKLNVVAATRNDILLAEACRCFFPHCNKNNVYTRVQKCWHLLQRLFAERTAEVVVQTPLYAVFTKGVTTGSRDWLKKQPFEDREEKKKSING